MERVSSPEEEDIEKSSATGVSTIYTGIRQRSGVRLPLGWSPKGDEGPSAGAIPPLHQPSSTVQSTSIGFSTGISGLILAFETPCAAPKFRHRRTPHPDPTEEWNPCAMVSSGVSGLNMKPGDDTQSGVASKTMTTPGRLFDSTLEQCNALSAKGHSLFRCRPASAKVLAFSLPQMPTCDGTRKHVRSTRTHSTNASTLAHNHESATGPEAPRQP